jgi:uncharacterized protein DUF6459
MGRRTARRSAAAPGIRLLRYPAGNGRPPHGAVAVDGSLALATGPPNRPPIGPPISPPAGPPIRPPVGPLSGDTELAISAEVIVRLCVEVFSGIRPLRQLTGWVTLRVWEELAELRPSVRAAGRVPPPRILTSWIQTPVPGEAEAGAVAYLGDRVHAIALRLERFRGRWRCRALETTIPPA